MWYTGIVQINLYLYQNSSRNEKGGRRLVIRMINKEYCKDGKRYLDQIFKGTL